MATESIFANPVIDTEWGIRALCDALDEYEAEQKEHWEKRSKGNRDFVIETDPVKAAALDRAFGLVAE